MLSSTFILYRITDSKIHTFSNIGWQTISAQNCFLYATIYTINKFKFNSPIIVMMRYTRLQINYTAYYTSQPE